MQEYGISRKRYAVFCICGYKCSACQEKQIDFQCIQKATVRIDPWPFVIIFSILFFKIFRDIHFDTFMSFAFLQFEQPWFRDTRLLGVQ